MWFKVTPSEFSAADQLESEPVCQGGGIESSNHGLGFSAHLLSAPTTPLPKGHKENYSGSHKVFSHPSRRRLVRLSPWIIKLPVETLTHPLGILIKCGCVNTEMFKIMSHLLVLTQIQTLFSFIMKESIL